MEFHDVVGDTSRMVDMFYEYGGFLHTADSITWRPAECKEYRFPWLLLANLAFTGQEIAVSKVDRSHDW